MRLSCERMLGRFTAEGRERALHYEYIKRCNFQQVKRNRFFRANEHPLEMVDVRTLELFE